MNGGEIKKAVSKAKQVAHAAMPTNTSPPPSVTNGNGGKKRRKGGDLKPIITTDGALPEEGGSPTSENPSNYK
jgi:serine/threonine-protein kinase SRPK3